VPSVLGELKERGMATDIKKQAVVISKEWNNPEIRVTIRDSGIQLECKLDDFLAALATEMTHPLVSFTKTRMVDQMQAAKNSVLDKIKQASIQVV
jgi:hypothetical protein